MHTSGRVRGHMDDHAPQTQYMKEIMTPQPAKACVKMTNSSLIIFKSYRSIIVKSLYQLNMMVCRRVGEKAVQMLFTLGLGESFQFNTIHYCKNIIHRMTTLKVCYSSLDTPSFFCQIKICPRITQFAFYSFWVFWAFFLFNDCVVIRVEGITTNYQVAAKNHNKTHS